MSKLIDAMKQVNDLNKTHGVAQRGGKKYTEVFVRVEAFRQAFGTDLGVDTQILVDDGKRVVVKATILSKEGFTVGSGLAEEIRGQGNVNKTSALENAETSAIGRALASLGLHGGSYASANEIEAVQRKEKALEQPRPEPDLINLRTHLGKTLDRVSHSEFAERLTKMFAVYAKTDKDKEGNTVLPPKRMTFLSELKDNNAEGIKAVSEALREEINNAYLLNLRSIGSQEEINKAHLKNLRSLGAQNGEE